MFLTFILFLFQLLLLFLLLLFFKIIFLIVTDHYGFVINMFLFSSDTPYYRRRYTELQIKYYFTPKAILSYRNLRHDGFNNRLWEPFFEAPCMYLCISTWYSGWRWLMARYCMKVANPSLSHSSDHQTIVVRFPNHWCEISWAIVIATD